MARQREVNREIRAKLESLERGNSSNCSVLAREVIGALQEAGISDSSHPFMKRYAIAVAKLEGVPAAITRPAQTVAYKQGCPPVVRKPYAKFDPGQRVFKGIVESASVYIRAFDDAVLVGESYRGKEREPCRVSWFFDNLHHLPRNIELFKIESHDSWTFLRYGHQGGEALYRPLPFGELNTINPALVSYTPLEQARTLANFGFGLCKKILRGLDAGNFNDYCETPFSGVHGHEGIMTLLRNNSTRYLNLRDGVLGEPDANGISWWRFPFSFSVAVK